MGTTPIFLATIGYELADLRDFIATLHEARVTRIIDIRELPMSRKKGFSKKALSEALSRAGIGYVHLRGLGDPKAGRLAARAGNLGEFVNIFSNHLNSEGAQSDLRSAVSLVAEGGACLLCYERDHVVCHRNIVASAISATMQVPIRHLRVRDGLADFAKRNERYEPDTEARA